MNKVPILILVLMGATLGGSFAVVRGQDCPSGSYSIGDNICKAEPTGCPYGDSIPLDSPKCIPPVESQSTPTPPIAPEPTIQSVQSQCNQGKGGI